MVTKNYSGVYKILAIIISTLFAAYFVVIIDLNPLNFQKSQEAYMFLRNKTDNLSQIIEATHFENKVLVEVFGNKKEYGHEANMFFNNKTGNLSQTIEVTHFEKETLVEVFGNKGEYENVMEIYNKQLDTLRSGILMNTSNNYFTMDRMIQLAFGTKRNALTGKDHEFVDKLKAYDKINVISLKWNNWHQNSYRKTGEASDYANVLNEYHTWAVTPDTCTHIPAKQVAWRKDCDAHVDNSTSLLTSPLEYNHASHYTRDLYVHVIQSAWINSRGYVRSMYIDILPNSCQMKGSFSISAKNVNRYKDSINTCEKEIFVIGQYWGSGFYHFSNEDLPRLVPHVEFLRQHPNIKIFTVGRSGFYGTYFEIIGLNTSRIVSGEICADIVYLPSGGGCAQILQPNGQILSHLARRYTETKLLPQLETPNFNKTLVLIKRTRSRRIVNFQEVTTVLQDIATHYGLQFVVYPDNPVPPLETTLPMFYSAVMVVAPHGAGISNILFSKPGTYVIEILCNSSPGPNLCYTKLAHSLGDYYHGMAAQKGCGRGLVFDTIALTRTAKWFLDDYIDKLYKTDTV